MWTLPRGSRLRRFENLIDFDLSRESPPGFVENFPEKPFLKNVTFLPCFENGLITDLCNQRDFGFGARLREGKGFTAPPSPDARSVSTFMFVGFHKYFIMKLDTCNEIECN